MKARNLSNPTLPFALCSGTQFKKSKSVNPAQQVTLRTEHVDPTLMHSGLNLGEVTGCRQWEYLQTPSLFETTAVMVQTPSVGMVRVSVTWNIPPNKNKLCWTVQVRNEPHRMLKVVHCFSGQNIYCTYIVAFSHHMLFKKTVTASCIAALSSAPLVRDPSHLVRRLLPPFKGLQKPKTFSGVSNPVSVSMSPGTVLKADFSSLSCAGVSGTQVTAVESGDCVLRQTVCYKAVLVAWLVVIICC